MSIDRRLDDRRADDSGCGGPKTDHARTDDRRSDGPKTDHARTEDRADDPAGDGAEDHAEDRVEDRAKDRAEDCVDGSAGDGAEARAEDCVVDHRSGRPRSKHSHLSVAAFREAVGAQEAVRRDAARRLHGTVLSKLTACSLWLGSVEQMISDSASGLSRDERVPRAMALLSRVRAELDQLRKSDVRLIEHMLYPGLIHLGLRAALESWREFHSRAVACEFRFDESFARCDGPSTDPHVIAVRLELFRLIEAIVDAWSTAGVAAAADAEAGDATARNHASDRRTMSDRHPATAGHPVPAGHSASGHRLEAESEAGIQLTVSLSSQPAEASAEDLAEPNRASTERRIIHLQVTAAAVDAAHHRSGSWFESFTLPQTAVDRFVQAGGRVRIVHRSEGTQALPTPASPTAASPIPASPIPAATSGIAGDSAQPWRLLAFMEGGFA